MAALLGYVTAQTLHPMCANFDLMWWYSYFASIRRGCGPHNRLGLRLRLDTIAPPILYEFFDRTGQWSHLFCQPILNHRGVSTTMSFADIRVKEVFHTFSRGTSSSNRSFLFKLNESSVIAPKSVS